MTAADYLPLVTERIVERFHPLKVILFGSMARGDARADSDLDLLVVLAEVENKHRARTDIFRALSDLAAPVDILVTTPEEMSRRGALVGPILRPAIKEGKVLFEQSGCRFEVGMTEEERQAELQRWLRYAREDLLGAESMLEDAKSGRAAPRQACFWAQQSAEKALKAVLVSDQIDFPRTHNVTELLALLPEAWAGVKVDLPDLSTLSAWAVQARYPDALLDASQAEAESAVEQAQAVWQAVSREFAARGITP